MTLSMADLVLFQKFCKRNEFRFSFLSQAIRQPSVLSSTQKKKTN